MSTPALPLTDRLRRQAAQADRDLSLIGAVTVTALPVAAPVVDVPTVPTVAARTLAVGRWFTRTVTLLILGVALASFLGLAVGPHVLGYRTETMLTGSMAPYINPGDVVVVTPMPVTSVRAGQVITFQAPLADHRVVSHRVLAVKQDSRGGVWIRTKGDANSSADPWTARLDGATAWHVRAVVPKLGSAIRTLRQPMMHRFLVLGVPSIVAAWFLLSVWRTKPEEQEAA